MSQFVRVAETSRAVVPFWLDGTEVSALAGDTVLTALLTVGHRVRESEFGGPRAGFCVMGACQDCWVWREDGARIRACTTSIEPGMRVLTRPPVFPPTEGLS
jgi:D-hydroxyproline dehydrogenase subunit gamma